MVAISRRGLILWDKLPTVVQGIVIVFYKISVATETSTSGYGMARIGGLFCFNLHFFFKEPINLEFKSRWRLR